MPLRPTRILAVLVAAGLTGTALLGGCGVPPELQPKPGAPVPSPSTPATSAGLPPGFSPPPTAPPATATSVAFPEITATECLGRPGADQVIAALRRTSRILPAKGKVNVVGPPMCAGTWQYTVLSVTGREPLQVVTKGAPDKLTVVTAGTDICTIEVRNFAPAGIRLTAGC
ncbi:hypothetical protein QEZ54_12175 [Catellatospora sp. KI3]|uniref:hypothetical protein n=1 Tax=Catellatospora sp. KI3 TaxID=3041620 RepID=UPI002482A476|nr:hypothetical protein [Catellatospora sp. KI3]MDI1461731.1 hypothetical protein [Catellatospora sp. KI3]